MSWYYNKCKHLGHNILSHCILNIQQECYKYSFEMYNYMYNTDPYKYR